MIQNVWLEALALGDAMTLASLCHYEFGLVPSDPVELFDCCAGLPRDELESTSRVRVKQALLGVEHTSPSRPRDEEDRPEPGQLARSRIFHSNGVVAPIDAVAFRVAPPPCAK